MRLVQRNERLSPISYVFSSVPTRPFLCLKLNAETHGRLQLGMIIEPRPDGLDIPIFPSQAVRRGVDANEIATVLKVSVERLGLRRVED
jgi:hypothetical protein